MIFVTPPPLRGSTKPKPQTNNTHARSNPRPIQNSNISQFEIERKHANLLPARIINLHSSKSNGSMQHCFPQELLIYKAFRTRSTYKPAGEVPEVARHAPPAYGNATLCLSNSFTKGKTLFTSRPENLGLTKILNRKILIIRNSATHLTCLRSTSLFRSQP